MEVNSHWKVGRYQTNKHWWMKKSTLVQWTLNIVWRAAGCQWNHRRLEGLWKRGLFKYKWSIGHSLLMTMFKFTNQCGVCTTQLVDIKCAFDITGDEKWELAKWGWALREGEWKEGGRSRGVQAAVVCLYHGVLHIFLIYPASACTKCITIKWIVFEVKSASVITGKGCWQCGSVERGTMDWGKDHNRTRNWVLLALVILLFNNYGESAHILELDN